MMRKTRGPDNRLYFDALTAFDCFLRPAAVAASQLIILLHGHRGTGKMFFDKFTQAFPENAVVLAPNAPFPLNVDEPDGTHRYGYSWYFYDVRTQEYLLDMRHAVDFLTKGLSALKLDQMEKTILGFSQGGYLALTVAAALTNVKHVIGVGCEFVRPEFQETPMFRVDGVHGEKDDIVSFAVGKKSHADLMAMGVRGVFHPMPDSGHAFDRPMSEKVMKILQTRPSQTTPS